MNDMLVVQPTSLAGYGRVVDKVSAWPTSTDWRGCVIVKLMPGHGSYDVGELVPYEKHVGETRTWYQTVWPDTSGT